MKAEIGTLLSLAVALISLGVRLIEDGEYLTGCVCLVVGVLLVYAVVLLAERHVVRAVERRLGELAIAKESERRDERPDPLADEEYVMRKLGVRR